MVNDPNPSSAESSSWLIRSVRGGTEVEDSSAEDAGFLIIQLNKRTKTTPRGKKQAGRQAEDWCTVKHDTL